MRAERRGRMNGRWGEEARGVGGLRVGELGGSVNGEGGRGGWVLAGAETVHYDRDRAWHG